MHVVLTWLCQVMELVKMKKPLTSLDFCYSGECENISVQESFPPFFMIIILTFPAEIFFSLFIWNVIQNKIENLYTYFRGVDGVYRDYLLFFKVYKLAFLFYSKLSKSRPSFKHKKALVQAKIRQQALDLTFIRVRGHTWPCPDFIKTSSKFPLEWVNRERHSSSAEPTRDDIPLLLCQHWMTVPLYGSFQ
jgi:hypothetical protein